MLPDFVPAVRVTARYLSLDGRPLSGAVEFRPPSLLTHSESDLFMGGPTLAPLDAEGRLSVTLPATDAPGWNPDGWTYLVTERVSGVGRPRKYQIALPSAVPVVDLADIAPSDPERPDHVAVPGPPGPPGEPGPVGPPGPVRSVNGHTDTDVVLTAADTAAVPAGAVGLPGGVAALGTDGRVPAAQLPDTSVGGVSSVNGRTGDVVLAATDLGALTPAAADARYLGLDAVPVRSVNGFTGEITLGAADVSAVAQGTSVLLAGAQSIDGAKTFTTPPATSADPSNANQLARRGYVDAVTAAGIWSPSAMGFSGWAYDPAASSATSTQYCLTGQVYLIGVPLAAPTTVSSVVFYVPGYVGGTLNSSSFAGLYTSGGARVGVTAPLNSLTATEGRTVVLPLTTAYAAQPGRYWVALLVNGPNPRTSGPAFMVGASTGAFPGGSARMPGSFVRHGRLPTTGQTSLPGSFTPSTVVVDANAIWAALA